MGSARFEKNPALTYGENMKTIKEWVNKKDSIITYVKVEPNAIEIYYQKKEKKCLKSKS